MSFPRSARWHLDRDWNRVSNVFIQFIAVLTHDIWYNGICKLYIYYVYRDNQNFLAVYTG